MAAQAREYILQLVGCHCAPGLLRSFFLCAFAYRNTIAYLFGRSIGVSSLVCFLV